MNLTARSHRVPLTGAALAVAALLAAGCGSSSSDSAGSTSAPATTTQAGATSSAAPSGTTAAPTSGAGASASAAPTATSAPGVPACTTSDLEAALGGSNGAAGSVYVAINFTNTGSAKCTLYGYPGVSLLDASNSQVGAAAVRNSVHAPTLVTLSPGAKANATLQVVDAGNYPTANCGPTATTSLRIYPPNQTQSLTIPYKTTGCSKSSAKILTVSVVTPGAGNAGG